MLIFDRDRSQRQLVSLHRRGNQLTHQYWNLGFERLTQVFPGLRSGIGFIFAPENVGKSMVAINLGYQLLESDPDTFWLDFSLDDSEEDRLGYLLGCAGRLPINLIKQSADAAPADQELRTEAFRQWNTEYRERHSIMALCDREEETEIPQDGELFQAEYLAAQIVAARAEIGPERKLFVTIDGFHDVQLGERIHEENAQQRRKSQVLKNAASVGRAFIMLTAHQIKHTRNRAVTADDMYGAAAAKYDAKVILHAYSDLNERQDEAQVVWTDETGKTQPILELRVLKNKGGADKPRLFYYYTPDQCRLVECNEVDQLFYRSLLTDK